MKKRTCPDCAVEIERDREICPICGYEFPRRSRGVQVMAWIMIILLLLWLLF